MGWKQKIVGAGWVAGLRTVDLGTIAGPASVTVDQLDGYVRQSYGGAGTRAWGGFIDHLRGLVALGCNTCGVRTTPGFPPKIALIIGRAAPDGRLDMAEATNYFLAAETWLRRLTTILPSVSLSEADKERARTEAARLAAGLTGAETAALAADILIQVVEAGRFGVCLTLHAVNSASPSFAEQWRSTDMVSTPTGVIANVNVLWSVASDELILAKRTGAERWENIAPDLALERLEAILRSVA